MFVPDRQTIRIALPLIPLLLPLNLFMFGDWMGVGLQWALVRLQQVVYNGDTVLGVFFLDRELGYVVSGALGGRSAWAVLVWAAGTSLLIAALLLTLCSIPYPGRAMPYRRYASLMTLLAGGLFLVSCMLQYGIALSTGTGFSIPAGVPAVLAAGYWMHRLDAEGMPADDGNPATEGD